ncbi:hypothetical protein OUZ56_001278 [Daphnia magna]|uniref:Uncharacterized protein n=1 Tax=Daphnia magna TaxID=35525 RepID=A0ABR0A258_9CRUS|nr:hypothetical protein OUZ56_001278 [Daphnia magna]
MAFLHVSTARAKDERISNKWVGDTVGIYTTVSKRDRRPYFGSGRALSILLLGCASSSIRIGRIIAYFIRLCCHLGPLPKRVSALFTKRSPIDRL